jgi:hypothetical protein
MSQQDVAVGHAAHKQLLPCIWPLRHIRARRTQKSLRTSNANCAHFQCQLWSVFMAVPAQSWYRWYGALTVRAHKCAGSGY